MKRHMIKFSYCNGAIFEDGDTQIEILIDHDSLIKLAHKVTTCLRWYVGPNKMSPEQPITLPVIGKVTHIDHTLFEKGSYETIYEIKKSK